MRLLRSLSLVLLLASTAGAQELFERGELKRWYLGFGGGVLDFEGTGDVLDSLKIDGWAVSAHLGYRLWPNARIHPALEVEGAFTQVKFDDELFVSGSSQSDRLDQGLVFGNLLLETRLTESLLLYAGGGAGAAFPEHETRQDQPTELEAVDDAIFAWQAKAGFVWDLSPRFSSWLGWRRIETDDVELFDADLDAGVELNNVVNVIEIGARWNF